MTAVYLSHEEISRLFQNHRLSIVNFLQNKVSCPDTAQDLSQEAYLRLLRQPSVPHAENLTGYLYRIAERLALDSLRQQRRITGLHVDLHDDLECPQIQPEQLTIIREQCQLLLEAIAAMPEQIRTVFLLRKIDELSYAEIAVKLGISEKTVQRHLVKAMLHCHKRLNGAV